MMNETTLNNLGAYIRSQLKRSGSQDTHTRYPFLTLSRQAGAGATTIAKLVTEKLNNYELFFPFNWQAFDKELIQLALESNRLPGSLEKYLPEDKNSAIKTAINESLHLHPPLSQLIRKVNKTLMALGLLGGAILVGRGANLVTRNLPTGIHLRLVGNLDKRIDHYAEHFGLSRGVAAGKVAAEDRARSHYVHKNFHADVEDPLMYTLVLNTLDFGFENSSDLIVQILLNHFNRLNN